MDGGTVAEGFLTSGLEVRNLFQHVGVGFLPSDWGLPRRLWVQSWMKRRTLLLE